MAALNPPPDSLPSGMAAALMAARRGSGRVSPNPLVGAALEGPDGVLVSRGHLRFGGPHAEARVLRDAALRFGPGSAGRLPRGCVLYVTLEPCCHTDKTGPCVELIRSARPDRVVVAVVDPDPRVSGRGLDRLRRAGIRVELGPGREQALLLNLAFHLRHALGRSLVRLKLATSLDSRLGPDQGTSRWVTGPEARRSVHRERAQADALVIGSETVLEDDPELTVRHVRGPQPSRIVIDSNLRTPIGCRLAKAWRAEVAGGTMAGAMASTVGGTGAGTMAGTKAGNYVEVHDRRSRRFLRRARLILATRKGWDPDRLDRYRAFGWEVWELPGSRQFETKVSLPALTRRAAREGFLRLLVEAGPILTGALLESDLVDELSLYQAPLILGGRRAWPAGWAASGIPRARRLVLRSEMRLGQDHWSLYHREGLMGKVGVACSPV